MTDSMEDGERSFSISDALRAALPLHHAGRLQEAEQWYQGILRRDPDHAVTLRLYGALCLQAGRIDAAESLMERGLRIDAGDAEAHCNLGVVQKAKGRFAQAQASFQRAIDLNPAFAEAYNNLGTVLQEQRDFAGAVASLGTAIKLEPRHARAHYNLGLALASLNRPGEAAEHYRRALLYQPDAAIAHNNLGNVLRELGRFDEAAASFRRAFDIDPGFAEAHANLGELCRDLGRLDEALTSYRRALELKPDYLDAHSNLLFTHNYRVDAPKAMLLEEARRYGETAARQARPYEVWDNTKEDGRVLHIGLVSGDLRSHPVGYFIESILQALSASAAPRLLCTAYANHLPGDAVTARIRQHCDGWRDVVGWPDERLAQQIRTDRIDILIDLSGHTARNRLPVFAWKAAPVQASWLGYFATTGVPGIDYLIADPWTLTPEEEVYFSESIWRLPETRLCFTPPGEAIAVSALPALERGHVTFGCFSNLSKLNDGVTECWSRILRALPGSRLLLKSKQLNDPTVRQAMQVRFARHGIGAERLIIEGAEARTAYLAAYHRVDLILDTFPFPGGTTTAEALWMGVPVLTLAGQGFLERQGVGLLMNAGLPDWVARDVEDYVARALAPAGELPRLAALRAALRGRLLASPLCDAPRFASHFEQAMRGMWRKYCEN